MSEYKSSSYLQGIHQPVVEISMNIASYNANNTDKQITG